MLTRGSRVVALTLVALASVGCAGKGRFSSASMCRAHGGTYNATAKSCTYTAVTKSAQETCQASGGYYDVGADVCEIGQE
jgi:TRAP-type uncharacterized transport system substrate-binding protein